MAASLLDLYRISGVPSFFVRDAVEAVLGAGVVAGFADAVVVAGFFSFAGVACAKE